MNQMLSALVTYPAPDGAALNDDFRGPCQDGGQGIPRPLHLSGSG